MIKSNKKQEISDKILKLFFVGLLMFSFGANAQTSKIKALVNGEIITNADLNDRVKNFVFVTKIPMNDQTRPMINQKVLHSAIDEKIKLQEASKNGVVISDKEVAAALKGFEAKNGSLKSNGLAAGALKEQMKADLAWVKLVRRKSFEETNITQKEVEIERAAAIKDINSPKRMVSEIFILKNKAKNLGDLVDNLRNDSRFELYAMQFSEAPSAGNGGRLGWINVGKFEEPLENALSKMSEGEISDPILSGNGYYILKLEKNFDPNKEKSYVPTEEEMKGFLQNKKMELFTQNYMQDLRQKAVIELR